MTIDIDNQLLQKAMELSRLKTKKAVIELALQEYINMMHRRDLLSSRGKVRWEGDLEQMRNDEISNE